MRSASSVAAKINSYIFAQGLFTITGCDVWLKTEITQQQNNATETSGESWVIKAHCASAPDNVAGTTRSCPCCVYNTMENPSLHLLLMSIIGQSERGVVR
ncbi:hypothetical protein C8R48DRAFT_701619 [Suillus tomentosus]|nr:hypothetical protein C8R48DRAFT_701619 [Suillus tomentosus]